MLSDNLRNMAGAMRHSTEAPACDLRSALAIYADVVEDAARLAAEHERAIELQRAALAARGPIGALLRLRVALRGRPLHQTPSVAAVRDLDAEFARHIRRGTSETANAICTLVDARAR